MYAKSDSRTAGQIFNIQRFSVHDGPGIRTTVFLKGCPLHCIWCHNPESITAGSVISFRPEQCIGCGRCCDICPSHAHRILGDQHVLNRELCKACGLCTSECHSKALEQMGRKTTVREVHETVMRDQPFYKTSGGGMTVSGGEPLLQPDFCVSLLEKAKQAGLHCCVDTSGYCDYSDLERISPYVDLFLYDWKESDPERHVEYCGVDNGIILENLRTLHDAGNSIRLRCPVIPGINDREDHFRGIAHLVNSLPDLTGVEILAFHSLGESKIKAFGLETRVSLPKENPGADTMQQWICEMKKFGVIVINPITVAVE